MAKDKPTVKSQEGKPSICSLFTRTFISLLAVLILFYQLNSLTKKHYKVSDFYQDKPSKLNYNFPSRFIKTNGISLNVITMGREENFDDQYSGEKDPLIIYLHGFPQAASTCWTNQLQDFEKRNFKYGGKTFALMAPDLRGYNTSEKPDFNNVMNYDLGELVHDIKGLIEGYYKNGKGKAVLVSHDWGAIIAWVLTSTYPEVVEKLIVLNVPHPVALQREIGELPLKTIFAQLKKSWYILFMQLGFSIPENYFKNENYKPLAFAYLDLAKKGILTMEDYHHYVKGWDQPNSLQAMMAYYKGLMTGPYLNTLKMKLGYPDARRYPKVGDTMAAPLAQQKVKVPTLILWGKDDIALIEESADLSFKYYIDESVKPKSKIIKFDAGHFIALEIPNTVIQEIEQFVSQQ